jgi:hypothetical protein
MNRKELLSLPVKPWDATRLYDTILIVPTRKKHDSGYMCMAVVGCIKGEPIEVAGYPDDVGWITTSDLRMDMTYPGGVAQMWGRGKFEVSFGYSSLDIKFIKD